MSYPPEIKIIIDKLKAGVEITKEEKEYRKYMNELVEWEEGVYVTRDFALSCIGDIY